jgi:hypothetical protein
LARHRIDLRTTPIAQAQCGEEKVIGARAVHIVTADDTEVIIPHAVLWSVCFFNASSGTQSLFGVTNCHLRADHDAPL